MKLAEVGVVVNQDCLRSAHARGTIFVLARVRSGRRPTARRPTNHRGKWRVEWGIVGPRVHASGGSGYSWCLCWTAETGNGERIRCATVLFRSYPRRAQRKASHNARKAIARYRYATWQELLREDLMAQKQTSVTGTCDVLLECGNERVAS